MSLPSFSSLQQIAYLFATLMLVKYYIFLLVAPFYPIKENIRKIRVAKLHRHKTTPKVSVIIPAWNEEVGIESTVTSVINNSYKNIEIVVVNDGSTDNTETVIKNLINNLTQTDPDRAEVIKYIKQKNGGKGVALNTGISNASGSIIMTIDGDSAVAPNAISNLVKYFQDPNISSVVGNVKVANTVTLIGFIQHLEYLLGFYFKRTHAVLGAEYIFGGACSAYRKSLLDEIGYFDTKNKTEDIELSMRIRYLGHHCTYAEDVICYTEGASTILGLVNQRLRWKKGRFDTFAKYRSMFFSTKKEHNKFLSWFVLPYALLAEFQLFFEPIAIALLSTYSFISGDYLSLTLGVLFISISYIVVSLFSMQKPNLKYLALFPFTWPLFYFLVWIEYLALIRSFILILRDDDVVWQSWDRQGIGINKLS